MSESRSDTYEIPPVMGTGDAVGMPSVDLGRGQLYKKKWLIARVQPNTEKSSCRKLERLRHEAFVVTQEEIGFWKNGERRKKKKVLRVIITQYVFVHVTPEETEQLLSYQFIKGYLLNRATAGSRRTYAELTEQEIERLKHLTDQSEYPVRFVPSGFTMGQEVTLRLGNFDYTANVFRILGEKSPCIGVRVKELGCAYIEVPMQALSKSL